MVLKWSKIIKSIMRIKTAGGNHRKLSWGFVVILLCFLMLLIITGQSQEPTSSISQPSLRLTVFPENPTSADSVEVRVGGGGAFQQALLVTGSNAFFAEEVEPPQQATYVLGALTPGVYTFSLFRQVPGSLFCSHVLIAELTFTVVRPEGFSGSELILLLLASNENEVQSVVARERPKAEWLFGNLAVLSVVPGLEGRYASLLRQSPFVKSVESNAVGFIPECPPPLGSAVALGSLLVSFKDEVARSEAEAFMAGLPPKLEKWESLTKIGLDLQDQITIRPQMRSVAWVRVPAGWEALFLKRYLVQPEVLCGLIAPHGSPKCNTEKLGHS